MNRFRFCLCAASMLAVPFVSNAQFFGFGGADAGFGGMDFSAMGAFGGMGGFGAMGGFGGSTQYNPSNSGKHVDFTDSNLPIIIIKTDGAISNGEKSTASMKVINNKVKRNAVKDKATDYDGQIGIKLRGNSSLSFEQKSFTIETRNSNGTNLNVSLFGMPAENDWVLVAPYNDISMIRNVIAYRMWENMGHWGPRTQMVEVIMNGEYIGVYVFTEKIKKDKNRLDIATIDEYDNSGRELTGGYILRVDAYDQNDLTFTSKVPGVVKMQGGAGAMGGFGGFGGGFGGFGGAGGSASAFGGMNQVVWTIRTPDKETITDEQVKYIENYIHETEAAIMGDDFKDPNKGYAKYISVSSFVDYLIHTEVSLNADGLKRSAYFYKTKQKEDGTGGKLHAGSVWDYNLAYGNCNFCNADDVTAWVYEGGETNPTPAMWKRLMEDPVFVQKVKDRYKELRSGLLSDKSMNEFIDYYAKLLNESQSRQYSKYSDLLVASGSGTAGGSVSGSGASGFGGGFGGFGGFGGGFGGFGGAGGGDMISWFAAYRVSDYKEEIAILKKWFHDRLAFLDSQWL